MKTIINKLQYALLMALFYPLSLLPLRVLYILSDGLYFLLYRCAGYRKDIVRINLTKSFPNKSLRELKEVERKYYHFLCDYFFETIKLLSISHKEMERRMTFSGVDEMMAELDGHPCIAYLGHYCNWEWVSSLPLHMPEQMHCGQIYHPLTNAGTDKFFLQLRNRHGAESITMNQTLRRILGLRNEGKQFIIGFIADQTPAWFSIRHWIDFLHQDTPVFSGAERIARQIKAPVYYIEMTRPRRGYYHGHFRKMTLAPQDLQEFALTDQYYSMLEEEINNRPEYWLWSHKRWKRQRNMSSYAY